MNGEAVSSHTTTKHATSPSLPLNNQLSNMDSTLVLSGKQDAPETSFQLLSTTVKYK